jgi:hypothetical protein
VSAMGTSLPVLPGLPDFGAPLPGPAATMFAPFADGSYAVLPEQLVVATDSAGRAEFLLEIEQNLGDFSSSAQFATLDMRLTGDYPLEAALAAARGFTSGATVAPLTIDSGFARLYATSTIVTPPAELLAPVSLGLGGQEGARWTMRVSADAGEILKAALVGGSDGTPESGAIPLGARMEYVASGVAARVPIAVEFQPAAMVGALISQVGGSASRMVAQSALTTAFTSSLSTLPVKVIGTIGSAGSTFAQAMEDRLLTAFASFMAAPGITDPACFLLADPATLDNATVHWDLSQPATVSRPWVVLFDPLSGIRTAIQKTGAADLVKYISLPPMPLGLWNIQVTTNLPPNRRGVVVLGANLEAPAHPPFRPASIDKQLVFSEPDDTATVQWRLSLQEQLKFTVTGYAVFAEAGSTRQDTSASRSADTSWVQMQQADFPVRFLNLSADPRVLTQADIDISLTYSLDGKTHAEEFTLTAAGAKMAIGLPRSASALQMTILATPHDMGAPLAVPSPASDQVRVDLTSFAEYGPHTVDIFSALAAGDPPLFIDLTPQSQQSSSVTPSKVMLTAEAPATTWSYLAFSPFSAGYCYRISAATDGTPAPWSKPFKPSSPLVLASDGSLATNDAVHPATVALPSLSPA